MKNKLSGNQIPCEVVRDLFPSYIDGLTSEKTNEMITEHVEECVPCKDILCAMKAPTVQPLKMEDKKELDFLKKNRRKNRIIALGSAVAAGLVIILLLFVKIFLIGRPAMEETLAWEVKVSGRKVDLTVMAGSYRGITDVNYKEENGVVKISVNCVSKSPFFNSDKSTEYIAETDIKQVWLYDRIIWSQGEYISVFTSQLYDTKHAYVGDMVKNFETANVLEIMNNLGDFSSELQTKEEPYGWKLNLHDVIPEEEHMKKEQLMQYYAYVLLAVIDNLEEVTYQYMVNGALHELTVNQENATTFAGMNIKECGREIALLQKLIDKTDLEWYVNMRFPTTVEMQETIRIKLMNVSDIDIASWALTYYIDGEACGTQVSMNADGSTVKKGDVAEFILTPEDFADWKWTMEDDFEIEITLSDENGREYVVDGKRTLQKTFWTIYKYEIHGNAEVGFTISQ